jgi:predicted RNA-binding protein
MSQYWLVVGTPRNWKFAFENGNIWGVKEFRELAALWNLLEEGDKLLFYVASPIKGVVGSGKVTTKFRQTNPLWPEEVQKECVLWPLRFEFEVEYCLPPSLWQTRCYRETNMQLITRMVFQCVPIKVVNEARKHLGLLVESDVTRVASERISSISEEIVELDHELVKQKVAEIGRIQGFLAEMEYPIEGNRLDVVWRRVERSVPTYVFEVQVGGDIYHALAKLKHAYDLWNSHIFLIADLQERSKYEDLLSGTFHEIKNRIRFVSLHEIVELHKRKLSYNEFEKELGIMQ